MIIETLCATLDQDGRPNFAPMGLAWGEAEMVVRPFRTTHTCRNLLAGGYGVAVVTDDVLAFVESALGDPALPSFPASVVPGVVYTGACYWRELKVISEGGSRERADIHCQVVYRGWQRDFLGFNRARGAIIEAAILATRLHLADRAAILPALDGFETIVRKTGDGAECAAMQRVRDYVRNWLDENTC